MGVERMRIIFLFTVDNNNSGFLTVETKDDTTSARDSDTTGDTLWSDGRDYAGHE